MIYQPEKDSFLMQKAIQENIKNKEISVLEIGIGSGIQLQTLKDLEIKKIRGIDINPEAVEHCKKLGFKVWKSNLFLNVKNKYNLIIFNPPYLPKDKKEDKESQLATTGGEKGSEIINKFLEQAKNYLTKEGRIFLLVSSLTKDLNLISYDKNLLIKEKLFFEQLEVYELTKTS
ncbi:MAG: HemK2/MTQ2 family protein methyltransferase [Nanoarchaeota archaeon]|nr:HemK2/MTQ2 family protein methyltransferase [Nanoarchaeota archaeon]